MNRSLALPILIAIFAGLSGCTSTPQRKETRCAGIDWWEMGRTDGVAGVEFQKGLAEHAAQCSGTTHPVDLTLYENGRDAGLVDYCSPQQGLAVGHSGSRYEHVCPSYLETSFLEQYRVGQRLFDLENEDHELEARIENLVQLLAKSQSGTALRAKIEELRARRAALDLEIARLENPTLDQLPPLPIVLDPSLKTSPERVPAAVKSSSASQNLFD